MDTMSNDDINALVESVVRATLAAETSVRGSNGSGIATMGVPTKISADMLSEDMDGSCIIPMEESDDGGGSGSTTAPGCYSIGDGGLLENCYILAGGMIASGPSGTVTSSMAGQVLAVRIPANGDDPELKTYSDFGAMILDQASNRCTMIPLYRFAASEDGSNSGELPAVEVDYRNMPRADIWSSYGTT